MVSIRLDDLPDEVRRHIAYWERESEIPDGFEPLDVPAEDYGFPDEE